MKERPILFSGAMVRAILEGRKTQTRRLLRPRGDYVVEDGVAYFESYVHGEPDPVPAPCPYGVPGDRLWVRETWSPTGEQTACYRADCPIEDGIRRSGYDPAKHPAHRWRPSIHMPRWTSRITLEVTAVRVELLQDISDADALAEGVAPLPLQHGEPGCWYTADVLAGASLHGRTPRAAFHKLWDNINNKRAPWDSNPWVWVVEFRRVQEVSQ